MEYTYAPHCIIDTGASVVLILIHAGLMGPVSNQTVDEELGIVMEDVTVS